MIELRFVASDLRALDGVRCEALATTFFEDERPLRGAAGLCDWRLAGRISRLLLRGRVRGRYGERLLIPGRPRLPFEKLFLFGLGPSANFDEQVFRAASLALLEALDAARVRSAAIALPGRAYGMPEPERAMELFVELPSASAPRDDLVVIESADAARAMTPVLERARRRARALEG